jgi:hypothetical protein
MGERGIGRALVGALSVAALVAACAPVTAGPHPDEIHVVSVPEAPGMVCFVDATRHPFHCAPLWVVLEAQNRIAAGE